MIRDFRSDCSTSLVRFPDVFDEQPDVLTEGLTVQIGLTGVENKSRPLCVSMDGLNVLDDVGGAGGYLEFLRTIHGEDPDEAEEMKQWGRSLGWTGRMSKPENVL